MPYVPFVPFTTLTRPEPIGDISLNQLNSQYTLPNAGGLLPMDRFIYALQLTWEGRITMPASGGPTAELADGRYQIIDEVIVDGFHIGRGKSEEFIRLRGADLRQLCRVYTNCEPVSTPASLNFTASATNDVRFVLEVPFVPLQLPWRTQLGWLLDAPNYRDLKLTIRYGDNVSQFGSSTNPPTYSAYGSASGSPKLYVTGLFATAGAWKFAGFRPGRVYRYYREINGSPMTTTATDVRLHDISVGHQIRSLMLKTGVKASVTSGNNAFSTLSDDILTEIKIFRGLNTAIRQSRNFALIKQELTGVGGVFTVKPDTGYALIDFVKLGHDAEILNTAGLVAGPSGSTDLYLSANVSGAANQALVVIYEEWRYAPFLMGATARTVPRRSQ